MPACLLCCLLARVCEKEKYNFLNEMILFASMLCCLAGHAEGVVLSTLERWLQEEAQQRGHHQQVMHLPLLHHWMSRNPHQHLPT